MTKADSDENIHYIGQAGEVEITFGGYKLTKENGLIGSSKIVAPYLNKPYLTHLFSMTFIGNNYEIREDKKVLDDRLLAHGDTLLLIYDDKEFSARLQKALDAKSEEIYLKVS
jgi:hypothetical protein